MSDDIAELVKRLREADPEGLPCSTEYVCNEAADALTSLSARLAQSNAALTLSERRNDVLQGDLQAATARAEAAEAKLAKAEGERDETNAVLISTEKHGTVYAAVERVLDERSAWVGRPDHETTLRVALAATIAANEILGRPSEKLADAQCALMRAEMQRDDAATERDAATARAERLEAALREAVDLYGQPGGPWNVPSDPGGWISRARAALDSPAPQGDGWCNRQNGDCDSPFCCEQAGKCLDASATPNKGAHMKRAATQGETQG